MKNAVTIFATMLFVSFSLPAAADWITLDASFHGEPVAWKTSRDNTTSLDVELEIKAVNAESVTIAESHFAALRLDDRSYTTEIGAPRIPVLRRLIEIPEGAEPEVDATASYQVYRLADLGLPRMLLPVQPSVEKILGLARSASLVVNRSAYQMNRFQFSRLVDIGPVGRLRGARVAWLTVRPLDYIPARGEIKIAKSMKIRIRFTGNGNGVISSAPARYADPIRDALLADFGLPLKNARDASASMIAAKAAPTQDAPAPSYAVVGSNEMYQTPELQTLLEMKTRKGYQVVFFNADDYGRDPAAIQSALREAYDSWVRPPAYVLLLGDTEALPAFIGTDMAAPKTDLPYGLMDDADLFPDLGVGRFPARDPAELALMAAKTLANESAVFDAAGWIQTAAFLASTADSEITEGSHNYVIANILNGRGYESLRLYSARGATSQQVRDAVEAGTSLVTYSGHGSTDAWLDGPYFNEDSVLALGNDKFPLVLSFACLTNVYDSTESLGETWMNGDHGALAFFGATILSFWDEDDLLERGLYTGFFGVGIERPLPWLAGMAEFGKMAVWDYYNGEENSQRYMEMYNLLGDPEQMIHTRPPVEPDAHLLGVIREDGTDLQFTVAGTPYAMAGLSRNGESLGGAWADSTGAGVLHASWTLAKGDEILLTVTGHNLIPASRTLIVGHDVNDDVIDDDSEGDDDSGGTIRSDPVDDDHASADSSDDAPACGC